MADTAVAVPMSAPEASESAATGTVGYFPESIAGGLAYLTFIPAVVFLTLDPYRRNRFVRFHSGQCLLLWAALLTSAAILRLVAVVLFLIPVAGPLLVWLLAVFAGLAAFFLWVALLVKALQGETFKLPLLGDLAARYAAAV